MNSSTNVEATLDSRNLEFLAFHLGGKEYGIDIQKVGKIRGNEAVTHIANAPDYIKGAVNLRGSTMDEVTQQNVSLVEEAAAESLQDQASSLAQVVCVFKLDGMRAVSSVAASVSEHARVSKKIHAKLERSAAIWIAPNAGFPQQMANTAKATAGGDLEKF